VGFNPVEMSEATCWNGRAEPLQEVTGGHSPGFRWLDEVEVDFKANETKDRDQRRGIEFHHGLKKEKNKEVL
jgi:hypothetical protein